MLHIIESDLPHIEADVLAAWRVIPTSIISDERNRGGTMAAAIKPVAPGLGFAGEALTVKTMVADNLALHHAAAMAWPGAAIVIDAGGHVDHAVWGELLQMTAAKRGVVGVVIDGSARDLEDLRQSPVAMFCRGIVPAGPHKGWGGEINVPIQCGGCTVAPGDIIVGDDDGVAVVPRDIQDDLLVRCKARLDSEQAVRQQIEAGASTVDIFKLPGPEETS
ncbi:MAG: RraA family protein [Rhodospirillales bacterium]|nr:RraA family protein [Rhodospirillales bacterium]